MNRFYAVIMWATHFFVMLGDIIVTASILAGLYLIFFGDLNLLGIFLMGLGIVGAIWAWKDVKEAPSSPGGPRPSGSFSSTSQQRPSPCRSTPRTTPAGANHGRLHQPSQGDQGRLPHP